MRIIAAATVFFCFIVFFASCISDFDHKWPAKAEGMIPIYSTDVAGAKAVYALPPQPVRNPGKIFTVGPWLFQVEIDSGIHVINYADPQQPERVGFIRTLLCKELTVKDGFIYTNNFSDLVVIDTRDMNNVKEASRVTGVFPDLALQYPPRPANSGRIYFECPDPSKGIIIGWKAATIENPKCYR